MTIALRPSTTPRLLVTLALVAAVITSLGLLLLAGFARPSLQPPVNLARNGLIAYDSGGDIWVAEANGTSPRRLTTDPLREFAPTWSPDGTRLVFWEGSARGIANLILVNADGG